MKRLLIVLWLSFVATMMYSACTKKSTKPHVIRNAVTDVDGNKYNAVKIGKQIWMKENLRTTHYADGTNVLEDEYFAPDDDESLIQSYGYLYTWPAVMQFGSVKGNNESSNVQGVCPNGWHVPSKEEWEQLKSYVINHKEFMKKTKERVIQYEIKNYGYEALIGDFCDSCIAKTLAAKEGWICDSWDESYVGRYQSANNATGFSAMPAGHMDNICRGFGKDASFWSSTRCDKFSAYSFSIYHDDNELWSYPDQRFVGNSVRCVRD